MNTKYSRIPIGTLVEQVKKWNPQTDKDNHVITYLDISSVSRESKRVEESIEIESHEAPSRARQLVARDDVLVSTVRPNLNAVAYLEEEFDGATASTGFCVLRTKSNKLDSRYLYYWVRTTYFIDDMVRESTGASYPAVSDSIIKNNEIPLPPLEEQKRIVAILDKADRVRRKRQEAIRLTEELCRSIFLDMFGDPVTNPKRWKVEKLEDFAMIQSGIAKGKKIKSDSSISVPYMRVANVQDGYIDLTEIKELTVSLEDSKKYLLSKGDLLLTEGGDPDKLGRGSVWYGEVEPCIHQNHIFCVRPNLDISKPEFLSKLIGSERGKKYFLKAAKQTTGIATINKTQLKAFPALIPPIELQETYVDKLKSIQNANIRFSQSYQESENLFNSLLQRAFQGEL